MPVSECDYLELRKLKQQLSSISSTADAGLYYNNTAHEMKQTLETIYKKAAEALGKKTT